MNTTLKTGLAGVLLLAVSCKKETHNVQRSLAGASDVVAAKYTSVLIGTQKWMLKNLNVTHYRNGDRIPQVKDPTNWMNLTTGAWCWYNNDSANDAVYGKLRSEEHT